MKITGKQLMENEDLQDIVLGRMSVKRVVMKNGGVIKGEVDEIYINQINKDFLYFNTLHSADVEEDDIITFYTEKTARRANKKFERLIHREIKKAERLRTPRALLWKYDEELGIAYCCPHCKTLFIAGHGVEKCECCGQLIDNSKDINNQHKGKLKFI